MEKRDSNAEADATNVSRACNAPPSLRRQEGRERGDIKWKRLGAYGHSEHTGTKAT